jgi:hypothetical protein
VVNQAQRKIMRYGGSEGLHAFTVEAIRVRGNN